jgi:hypothetical protein
MTGPRSRLEIQIDELVVRGLSPAQARSAVAALEARLAILGTDWAASSAEIAPRDEAFRRVPAVRPPSAEPAALGESAASAVWTAVTGGDERR